MSEISDNVPDDQEQQPFEMDADSGGTQNEQSEELTDSAESFSPSDVVHLDLEGEAPANELVETPAAVDPLANISYLPTLELLKSGRQVAEDEDEDENDRKSVLEHLFDQFKVNAKVTGWKRGPQMTRFEVQMGRGTRADSVTRLRDEIRMALAADRVNILAPVPGKNIVGIEVQRKFPDIVSLGDVLRAPEALLNEAPLLIGIGQDVDGTPVLADIAEMPHLLVAGATGSGKSSFINSLICSLLTRTTADQVSLVLIDPKRVELTQYAGIPQLVLPVIHDSSEALSALTWLIHEMDERYKLLERHRVNKIERYNSRDIEKSNRYPEDPIQIPRIVVIIDELADLIKTTNHEAEKLIVKLTQLGRAAGIHLVVATQRPSVDVITGLIKANISTRLAFATASQVDSRVILDQQGAENLSGKGDGLFALSGIASPVRVQAAYVDEDEIHDIVMYAQNHLPNETYTFKATYSPEEVIESIDAARAEVLIPNPPVEETKVTSGKDALYDALIKNSEDSASVQALLEDGSRPLMEFEQFDEPDWRVILELLDRRIEPCDLTGAMVDVSKSRKSFRAIEVALSKVRVAVMKRIADRSEFRYRDKINQANALEEARESLNAWRSKHSNSVAWQFYERAISELGRAECDRQDARSRVENARIFKNATADETYADFAKRLIISPIVGTYIFSVLLLTYNRFHIVLKFIPPFNLGMASVAVIVYGFVALNLLSSAWKYSSRVIKVQQKFVSARINYNKDLALISHTEYEKIRLAKQVEVIEPFLRVLAEGYSSRWAIDESLEVTVSTGLDTSKLPACVGFARAIDGPDDQVAKLRDLAIRQLVRPGWRTEIISRLAEEYGEKTNRSLQLADLDADTGISNSGARELFVAAFNDVEMAKRLGKEKLFELVNLIHNDVIRNAHSDLRPPVQATRRNGFESIETSTDWLVDSQTGERWIEYLSEILQEAPPFGYLAVSASGRRSPLAIGKIQSYAVIPKYMNGLAHESVSASQSAFESLAPIDVAVRVDVSEWGELSAFVVFADEDSADIVQPIDESPISLTKVPGF